MCQEIYIDGQEILRENDTCWCPLSDSYGAENPDIAKFDLVEQQKAFQELGKAVWKALTANKHPGAQQWIAEITLQRW